MKKRVASYGLAQNDSFISKERGWHYRHWLNSYVYRYPGPRRGGFGRRKARFIIEYRVELTCPAFCLESVVRAFYCVLDPWYAKQSPVYYWSNDSWLRLAIVVFRKRTLIWLHSGSPVDLFFNSKSQAVCPIWKHAMRVRATLPKLGMTHRHLVFMILPLLVTNA